MGLNKTFKSSLWDGLEISRSSGRLFLIKLRRSWRQIGGQAIWPRVFDSWPAWLANGTKMSTQRLLTKAADVLHRQLSSAPKSADVLRRPIWVGCSPRGVLILIVFRQILLSGGGAQPLAGTSPWALFARKGGPRYRPHRGRLRPHPPRESY